MDHSKRTKFLILFLTILMVLLSIHIYSVNITTSLNDSVNDTLNELMSQQKFIIDEFIDSKKKMLYGVADTLAMLYSENTLFSDPDEIADIIHSAETHIDFENVVIAQTDGIGYGSNHEQFDLSDFDLFNKAIQGYEPVSNLTISPFSGKQVITFAIPIQNNSDQIVGAILAEISTEMLEEHLISFYDDNGVVVLIDENANIIATTSNNFGLEVGSSILDIIHLLEFPRNINPESFEEILIATSRNGFINYSVEGESRRFQYLDINQTNWTLLVSIPEHIIYQNSNHVILNTSLLFLEIIVIMLIMWARTNSIKKNSLKEIERFAYYDDMTGLMNQKKFKIEVEKTIKANEDTDFSIVKIDIANFKVINKLFNYEIGNEVINIVAKNLQHIINVLNDKHILCSRIAADEFLLFGKHDNLINLGRVKSSFENSINEKIYDVCSRKVKFRYSRYKIPPEVTNIDEIIDMVLLTHNYCRKIGFRGIYDYDDDMKNELMKTTEIIDNMQEALDNQEFIVYLQPKYYLSDGSLYGCEALVRWKRPNGELMYPSEFIPIFEQEGFIVKLDTYMLKKVCEIAKRFRTNGLGDIPISVNFSRLHMLNKNFSKEITRIVDSYDIPRSLIEIEMTETSMVESEQEFKELFQQLHDEGFKLSMDDFGAGYSSLDLLSELNFDVVKLDKSLLAKSEQSDKKKYVIEAILNMAKGLNLQSVCEGVETLEQLELLKSLGCDIAQGYYYSKPIPNEDFEKLLKKL